MPCSARNISPTTSATLTLTAARIDSVSTGIVARTQTMMLGLKKQLTSKLNCTIDVRRDLQESVLQSLGYRENAIEAMLTLQL